MTGMIAPLAPRENLVPIGRGDIMEGESDGGSRVVCVCVCVWVGGVCVCVCVCVCVPVCVFNFVLTQLL